MSGPLSIQELEARLNVNHDQIPAKLKLIPQWVNWRYEEDPKNPDGKPKKRPFNPRTGYRAKVDDPSTWGTYEQARKRDPRHVGFVFTKGCGYFGVDLDGCRNYETSEIEPEANQILLELNSWTEGSPSGTGFHIIGEAELPPVRKTRIGNKEVYSERHYLTFTGNVHPGFGQIRKVDGTAFLSKHGFITSGNKPSDCQGAGEQYPGTKYLGGRVLKKLPKWIKEALDEVEKTTCGDGGSDQDFACIISILKDGWTPKDVAATFIDSPRGEYAAQRGHKMEDYVHRTIWEALKRLERRVVIDLLSEIKTEKVEWLLQKFGIPRHMYTYEYADEKTGKTVYNNLLTAEATKLGFKVLRFNKEDDASIILKPCLHAAGADLTLVGIPRGVVAGEDEEEVLMEDVNLSNIEHRRAIQRVIEDFGADLVIFEPVTAFKGAAKGNGDDDMEPIHGALLRIAQETGAAIIGVGHTNRRNEGTALHKALGSGSSTRTARVNYYLQRSKELENLVHVSDVGSNIQTGPNRAFRLENQPPFDFDGKTNIEGVTIAVMAEAGSYEEKSATELLEDSRKPNHTVAIVKFLMEFLRNQKWVSTDKIKSACRDENKDWSWGNIRKIFSEQFVKKGLGATKQEGRYASWTIDLGPQLINGHDRGAESSQPAIAEGGERVVVKPGKKELM